MTGSSVVKVVLIRGVSILATFVLTVCVARALGPAEAGTFFVVFTLLALLATLGRFGADNLALRLLGGDTKTPRSDVLELLKLAAIAACFAAVIGFFVVHVVVGPSVEFLTLLLVSSCVVAQSLSVTSGAVLRGLGRLGSGVFAELGSLPLIATAVIVAADSFLPAGIDIDGALLGLAIGSWGTVLWAAPSAITSVARLAEPRSEVQPHRGIGFLVLHWRKLIFMMGSSVLAYAVVWAPIFILTGMSNMAEVSYYSVALRVANMVALLPAIQVSYLAPEFARRFYADDLVGLNRLAARSVLQVTAITAAPLAALVVFARPIVELIYGEEFLPAAQIMTVLSVGVFVVILCGQVNQLMLLCGLEHIALLATATAIVLWGAVGPAVGSHFGAFGVSWVGAAISVLYAVSAAALLRFLKGIHSYIRVS